MLITPQNSYPKLARALGLPEIILKREDLHPYGSHKGRSIPYMIEKYMKQGYRDFAISSSGNAALAALNAALEKKVNLKVFVGKNINKSKLNVLESIILSPYQGEIKRGSIKKISIEQVANPKQQAFLAGKKTAKVINLRQSTDDLALAGYKTLAAELKRIKNLQAIFVPTSSGTTAQALGKFLPDIQIHIAQTTACHPIAEIFSPYEVREHLSRFYIGREIERGSLANAIVDKVAHRKEKVIEVIKTTNGFGWIISDEEIKNAIKLVKETADIDISPNSALALAGLQKAIKNGWRFTDAVVCLITGK